MIYLVDWVIGSWRSQLAEPKLSFLLTFIDKFKMVKIIFLPLSHKHGREILLSEVKWRKGVFRSPELFNANFSGKFSWCIFMIVYSFVWFSIHQNYVNFNWKTLFEMNSFGFFFSWDALEKCIFLIKLIQSVISI